MKHLFLLLAAASACGACSSNHALYDGREPLAVRIIESEIARNPSPANLDGIAAGKIKWNYTTGLELLSFMDAAEVYDRPDFYDYAVRYYDSIVQPDGSVLTYKKEKYNLDHICPGRPLFAISGKTGDVRYRRVLDTLYAQLQAQPRNADGGFWHKQTYPHQMWLDGLYMGEPFYAEYAAQSLSGAARQQAVEDIANQFVTVGRHTYDSVTGLYRHAYDDSRAMFWCDSVTGQSAHAWGRAMGWYAMAIVETLQYTGADAADGTREMVRILNQIYQTLPRYADPVTGMWYQVLDQPAREGNYLESTASAMFVYALLKGVRLGYLPAEMKTDAMRLYEQFVNCFVRENGDGTLSLTGCCAVAGLGGKEQRSGTFDYYISEPVIENDCKGIGPLVWASIEYDRAKGRL